MKFSGHLNGTGFPFSLLVNRWDGVIYDEGNSIRIHFIEYVIPREVFMMADSPGQCLENNYT